MTVLFFGTEIESLYLHQKLGMNLDWLSKYTKENSSNSTYLLQCTWKRSYAMTCVKYQLKMYNKASNFYDHALWISEYDHSWKGEPYIRDRNTEKRYYFKDHFSLENSDFSALQKCKSGYYRLPGLSYTNAVYPKNLTPEERGVKLCPDGSEAIYNHQGKPICFDD